VGNEVAVLHAGRGEGVAKDGAVRATRELDGAEAVFVLPQGSEGRAHGAATGAAAGDEGAVDVEQEEAAGVSSHQLSVFSFQF
jgi:hypothetical protein